MSRVIRSYTGRLDHEATAANAEAVLVDYRHRKQKARRSDIYSLHSPVMDGMPKSPSVANGQEGKVLASLSDQEFVSQVNMAIERIENDESRELLRLLFITQPITAEAIQERLGMSNTAYYHAKETALVAFAEVWPPVPSELLVYRTVRDRD